MDPYYEQRLRDEVIYLHSLWHQGPPRPAAAAAAVSAQLRPVKPTQFKKKKKKNLRADIGQKSTNSATETNSSVGAEWPSTAGGPSPAPKPQSQPNSSGAPPQLRPVKPTQFKKKKKKKPRAEIGQKSAAETNSSGGAEWPCPLSPPPPSTTGWPSPAPKPQSQPNPLSIEDQLKFDSRNAHRMALRVVSEFIANNYAEDSDDMDSSSDEDDEFMGEDHEYRFFFKVFKDDTELREFYKKNFARGEFSCLICGAVGGKKSTKKFNGCLPLVQHSITIAKTKKRRAHRAFGQAICKVLGWDIDNLGAVVSMLSAQIGDATGAGSSDIKESSMTLISNVVSVNNGDLEGKDEEAVPESADIRRGLSVNGDEGNVVAAARDGGGSSDNMESSVTLISNVVPVNNDDLEGKDGEAVPESVDVQCGISVNGDAGNVVTAARDGAGSSDNMESSVDPVGDIVSVNNDDLEDKNEAVPETVEIRSRIALNGDEGDVNPVTCRDAGINSEDGSMVLTDNVEKPASDGLTSTITCPDAGRNSKDDSMVLTDNVEKPASDGLTSTITCPDAGTNLEDDSMVRIDNVEKPASDGLTSNPSACPDADKSENLGMEHHHNMEETSSQGLASNSLTSTDADKPSENLGVVHPLNMEDTAPELQQNVPLNNHVGDEVQDLKTD